MQSGGAGDHLLVMDDPLCRISFYVEKKGVRSGVKNKRLTVKEGNKLNSEWSCLVLLSAPLDCTQLLPGKKKANRKES